MVAPKRGILVVIALAVLLAGCAGTVKNMRELAGDTPLTPQKDKAMIVFMRPSGLGHAIQSSVFELKGEQPQLVGIVAAKTKVAHQVEPRKHTLSAESHQWMQENISSIRSKRAEYYAEWASKPEAEKERLLPDDGI